MYVLTGTYKYVHEQGQSMPRPQVSAETVARLNGAVEPHMSIDPDETDFEARLKVALDRLEEGDTHDN